jgi:anti-sigma factor RsiW
MRLNSDQLERLALHSAFGLHLIAKWMATRADVDPEIRDRLAAHLEAIDGVLVNNGHDWIRDEIEATEAALHS